MDRGKYYLAKAGTETHRIITEMHAKRAKGMRERWKFVEREFPDSKKKKSGYEVASWTSPFGGANNWGVKLPLDATGKRVITSPDWKFTKDGECIKPRLGVKRGKELNAEMQEEKYAVPGATEFGHAVGIKPEFIGFALHSPGFTAANNGDYIITLYGNMKPPKDTTRISDIEVEKLTATPRKKGSR